MGRVYFDPAKKNKILELKWCQTNATCNRIVPETVQTQPNYYKMGPKGRRNAPRSVHVSGPVFVTCQFLHRHLTKKHAHFKKSRISLRVHFPRNVI